MPKTDAVTKKLPISRRISNRLEYRWLLIKQWFLKRKRIAAIVEYFGNRKIARLSRKALYFMDGIDHFMKDKRWPRQKRREFWHKFQKSAAFREDIAYQILEQHTPKKKGK
ncbi:MAG: hypothetical protein PHC43_01630 [Candidatus Marinimicrobia bacterium]|jgi:hypothetical protein|nr:hypothetical protein [Candidatus Neomarinimicrobiota bacterium]MDD5230009.1 hypothetical protein [Candidatus Neomarinimicrobiota bacterium]MDD5540499.1 hypothetical protein [Candidatus Neomarinimicrobiota bacterium]